MRNFFLKIFGRFIFRFLYFAGLTFLIPYILSLNIPGKVFFFTGSPHYLLYIALACIIVGIIGIHAIHGDTAAGCKTLGYITLIPILLSLIVLIFGTGIITNIGEKYARLQPLINYWLAGIPNAWYLLTAYMVIAITWFIVGKRLS